MRAGQDHTAGLREPNTHLGGGTSGCCCCLGVVCHTVPELAPTPYLTPFLGLTRVTSHVSAQG